MKQTKSNKVLVWLLLVSLVIGFLLLRDYLILVVLALIIGYAFQPLHQKVLNFTKGHKAIASGITILIIILILIVPLTVVGILTIDQLNSLNDSLAGSINSNNFSLTYVIQQVNDFLASIPGLNLRVEEQEAISSLRNTVQSFASTALSLAVNFGTSILGWFSRLLIFISVLSAVLNYYPRLVEISKDLSPLPHETTELFIKRMFSTSNAMLKGIFIVAIVQGIISAILLQIAGVDYVFFLGISATVFSVLPIGAGFILIPIGLILIALGNVPQGLLLVLGSILIVSSVDNVLRPKLASKESQLHPALLLLGIFGGIQMFGFLGVIIGPMLLIFVVTAIEVYLSSRKSLNN